MEDNEETPDETTSMKRRTIDESDEEWDKKEGGETSSKECGNRSQEVLDFLAEECRVIKWSIDKDNFTITNTCASDTIMFSLIALVARNLLKCES